MDVEGRHAQSVGENAHHAKEQREDAHQVMIDPSQIRGVAVEIVIAGAEHSRSSGGGSEGKRVVVPSRGRRLMHEIFRVVRNVEAGAEKRKLENEQKHNFIFLKGKFETSLF